MFGIGESALAKYATALPPKPIQENIVNGEAPPKDEEVPNTVPEASRCTAPEIDPANVRPSSGVASVIDNVSWVPSKFQLAEPEANWNELAFGP